MGALDIAVRSVSDEEGGRPHVDIGATLRPFRHGQQDPTTTLTVTGRGPRSSGRMVRATWTPDGPATVAIGWSATTLDADAWGPGAEWILARVPAMVGTDDDGADVLRRAEHPVVAAAADTGRHLRIGASGDLYHELLPTIIEQRITTGEAKRHWRRLCRAIGPVAPGPFAEVRLPPCPDDLRRRPTWWFHPLGIEVSRARALIAVAEVADRLWDWVDAGAAVAARQLATLPRVGVWTIGSVLGPALGDADAVPVGDFHVKNNVAWALAAEPRGTDERMLELLEPYRGQRGRVVRLLGAAGHRAPAFGPKRRVISMERW